MPKPLRWIPLVALALAAAAWLPGGPRTRPQLQPPTGTLDRVADGFAEGWALDPNVPTQAVTVRFYVDAAYPQGTLAGETTTDIIRTDVNLDRGVSGAHGFRWAIPAEWTDGRPHDLHAYAVDTDDPSVLVELFESPKPFTLGTAAPVANADQPYEIGAWYFTAWSRFNDSQAVTSLDVFGRRDAWGGVRDHARGDDPWNLGVNYANREPLLGFYDMAEQSVVDAHIRQAASGGLSFFATYWYWNTDRNEEDAVSVAFRNYLTSPYKDRVRFLLAPIALGQKPMTHEIWRDGLVPYMIETYLSDPAYYTMQDGRPVVILFDTGFRTVADDQFAVAELRRQARDRLGVEPFLLWLHVEDFNPEHVAYILSDYGVDGFACFQLVPSRSAEPYAQTLSRWDAFTRGMQGGFHIPCASTGFDRRPWYKITYGWFGEPPNSDVYNTDMSPAAFRQHLANVKSYLDGHASRTGNMLIVYAWNEWAEGGILEPSRVEGYAYLDAVTQVFGLIPTMDREAAPPVSLPTATRRATSTRTPTPQGPLDGLPLPSCLGSSLAVAGIGWAVKRRRGPG